MFAGDPTVIGFDLRNEPHTPAGDTYAQGATWGTGDHSTDVQLGGDWRTSSRGEKWQHAPATGSLMGDDGLHVVFGTGQVGQALVARPGPQGLPVRAVSRHRPPELADGIDWQAADATDASAASDAAKGTTVVYQCLNAPTRSGRSCSPRCSAAC